MKLIVPLALAVFAAACGQPAHEAKQEPYSAPSSPDARGQTGYVAQEGYANQQDSGAEGGRGSAATGASGDGPAGDANSQSQPTTTP
jgi:hypothetical protein